MIRGVIAVLVLSFALLAAAILIFLYSTRQFRVPHRLAVWVFGACLLVGSMYVFGRSQSWGVPELFLDAVHRPLSSILLDATLHNWRSVARAAPSMFLVSAAFAAFLSLVALIALTPGEAVERVVRPLNIGLIGAVLGGFAALALVASGLAGYQKDRAYIGKIAEEDVLDGDTIRMGDVSLRLNGIDAPEYHEDAKESWGAWNQPCVNDSKKLIACGQAARKRLIDLVSNRLVVCRPPDERAQSMPPKETMGRPIVECEAHSSNGQVARINRELVERGDVAVFRKADGTLRSPYPDGLFKQGCTLKPSVWRNNEKARSAFLATRWKSVLKSDTIGDCSMLPLKVQ